MLSPFLKQVYYTPFHERHTNTGVGYPSLLFNVYSEHSSLQFQLFQQMSHLLVGLLLLLWILCPLFYPAAKTNKFTAHLQHQFTSTTALTKPFSHSPLSTATAKNLANSSQIPQNLIRLFPLFDLTSLHVPFHCFTDQPLTIRIGLQVLRTLRFARPGQVGLELAIWNEFPQDQLLLFGFYTLFKDSVQASSMRLSGNTSKSN